MNPRTPEIRDGRLPDNALHLEGKKKQKASLHIGMLHIASKRGKKIGLGMVLPKNSH